MATKAIDSWPSAPGRATRVGALRRIARLPLFPIVILGLVLFCGVLAPLLEPHDPTAGTLSDALLPPAFMSGGSMKYLLGTDPQGRDIFSRIIGGARVSMLVGVTAVLAASCIGAAVALLAGYTGGWVDQLLSRLTDIFLALPFLLVALAMVVTFGPSIRNLVIILLVMGWASYARVLRGEVLKVAASDYVRLARISGASSLRIMILHILPNIANTLVVLASLQLGLTIIAESSLSFLGLGVPPPNPSWGGMLATGREYLSTSWWIAVFPGFAIMLTVLASNLFGDWLRVAFDPNLRT